MFVCDLSLCVVAWEAGGRDSDREGQMETEAAVCHGWRNTGNPSSLRSSPLHALSFPLSFLLPPSPFSPYLRCPSSPLPVFLSCRLLSVCSSLPVPSSGCHNFSGIPFCSFSLLFHSHNRWSHVKPFIIRMTFIMSTVVYFLYILYFTKVFVTCVT